MSENLIIQHVLVWEHAFHVCNVIIHACMCFHERIVFIRERTWKGHDAESRGIGWFHDCNDSRLESQDGFPPPMKYFMFASRV